MTNLYLQNNDVFVTHIETNPDYYVTASYYAAPSLNNYFVLSSSEIVLRSYLNCNHHYYLNADPTQIDIIHSATIKFRKTNTSTDSKTYSGLLQLLCKKYYEYYPNDFDPDIELNGTFNMLSIPKCYYGERIVENSFFYHDHNQFGGGPNNLLTYVWDNGSGSLVMLANVYDVAWNFIVSVGPVKAGNIFYHEGIAFITQSNICGVPWPGLVGLNIQFSGSNKIQTQNVFCHIPAGELNVSSHSRSNYAHYDYDVGTYVKNHTASDDRVFITGIGLYDDQYRLVATAKMSSPIRNKLNDKLLFKLRIDL